MEKYQTSTCSCCGKPLTDPISVEIGIGPVCRVQKKMEDMNEKTGNLFSNRSDYDYWFDGNVLAIEDLGGYKSVTNDIENVIHDITRNEVMDIMEFRIMYKDSMGIWDGISLQISHGSLKVNFFSLNERLYQKAKEKLLSNH